MDSLQPTYNEMVKDALLDDSVGFTEKFMGVMSYKLANTVKKMQKEVSSSLLDETYELDEGVGSGSKSFIFRSTKDAREFSKGLTEAGLAKKSFLTRGNTVTIKNIPDRDMEEMVISMAKDMKARISEELNILLLMKESVSDNSKLPIVLNDKSFVVLSTDDCEAIINLHDSLNSDNQLKLRSNLMESEDSFIRILEFAYANATEEEN